MTTHQQIKISISACEAERNYFQKKLNKAISENDTKKEEMYQIISSGFNEMVYRLRSLNYPN